MCFIEWEKHKPKISLCLPPALKMKIKEVKKDKGDRKLIAAQKKKKVLKLGVLRKKDLKKLTLYIKNGANCPCSQLDSLGSSFLIMGRKVDQQLLLMSIHKWDKKSKELKFAIKYMKSHQCPTYHTVFQWHAYPHLNPAQFKTCYYFITNTCKGGQAFIFTALNTNQIGQELLICLFW